MIGEDERIMVCQGGERHTLHVFYADRDQNNDKKKRKENSNYDWRRMVCVGV